MLLSRVPAGGLEGAQEGVQEGGGAEREAEREGRVSVGREGGGREVAHCGDERQCLVYICKEFVAAARSAGDSSFKITRWHF